MKINVRALEVAVTFPFDVLALAKFYPVTLTCGIVRIYCASVEARVVRPSILRQEQQDDSRKG